MLDPQEPLEGTGNVPTVEQLDLVDQPIESKPDRWIADAIHSRQILERPRGQYEPLDKGEILVLELVDPGAGRAGGPCCRVAYDLHIINSSLNYIKDKKQVRFLFVKVRAIRGPRSCRSVSTNCRLRSLRTGHRRCPASRSPLDPSRQPTKRARGRHLPATPTPVPGRL